MKIVKVLSLALLFTLFLSCDKEEAIQPSADVQENVDPLDLTQEDLMAILEEQNFEGISKSRKSSAVSFNPVMEPATGTEAGRSLLVRTRNGLGAVVCTKLIPGHTYTLWWAVFNNPGACNDDPFCGAAGFGDFLNEDTEVSMLYADGALVKRNGYGVFTAYRRNGDISGAVNNQVLGIPDLPITNSKTSHVFLVVRSHGPAIPGQIKEQITTWEGGCSTFYIDFTIPIVEGECSDMQMGIHIPE